MLSPISRMSMSTFLKISSSSSAVTFVLDFGLKDSGDATRNFFSSIYNPLSLNASRISSLTSLSFALSSEKLLNSTLE